MLKGKIKGKSLLEVVIAILALSTISQSIIQVRCVPSFDHCYSDIGCFPLRDEFYHPRHRPFNVRPWHRRRINTHFELFSRKHPEGFILTPWDRANLKASEFNPLLETKIIIPGWLDNIKRALWVKRMKDSLLWLWHPINIIVVHWRNFTPYTVATANTRVVGAELANLIRSIEYELNYDRGYYHLIGHSLGAHISGYCGDRLPGLGRITALDPARPFFQHMPKSVRLDKGDAKFVDAIHSDFTPENAIFLLMSFGMTTPVGHADFYPNGPPLLQPGCLRDSILSIRNGIQRGMEHSSLSIAFLESIRYLTACDHQRSHEWFIESITNRECVFIGVRCNEFDGLINGQCTCDNSPSACAVMGIHADQMYLNNAHEDIWPLRNKMRNNQRPLAKPSQSPFIKPLIDYAHLFDQHYHHQLIPDQNPNEPLRRPAVLREQLYAEMKYNANKMRYPPAPQISKSAANAFFDDLVTSAATSSSNYDLSAMIDQDEVLLDYLGANLHQAKQTPQDSQQQLQKPIAQSFYNSEIKRNFDSVDQAIDRDILVNLEDDLEDNFVLKSQFPTRPKQILDEHPRLMSDVDREIEQWYENSSRWYLKTNSRSKYCANQYQVLVYVGPLKITTGRKNIRANLILSIIGSRGQLLNQRFTPRSKTLDSFTMQPFFIILEGSYSLGNILWVAIGWEARYDPDPIQATVSFQSNLIESLQALTPYTYHAKHPWLSETLKYDHSKAFGWSQQHNSQRGMAPIGNYNQLLSQVGVHLDRRSMSQAPLKRPNLIRNKEQLHQRSLQGLPVDSLALTAKAPDSCSSSDCSRSSDQTKKLESLTNEVRLDNQLEEQLSEKKNESEFISGDITSYRTGLRPMELNATAQESQTPLEETSERDTVSIPDLNMVEKRKNYNHIASQLLQEQAKKEKPHLRQNFRNHKPTDRAGNLDITAELHNIGIHLDRDTEDSIVISQILISPIQAHYGKNAQRVGRTFCPPHRNFRLRRDQTVRMVPNSSGKCNAPVLFHKHSDMKNKHF